MTKNKPKPNQIGVVPMTRPAGTNSKTASKVQPLGSKFGNNHSFSVGVDSASKVDSPSANMVINAAACSEIMEEEKGESSMDPSSSNVDFNGKVSFGQPSSKSRPIVNFNNPKSSSPPTPIFNCTNNDQVINLSSDHHEDQLMNQLSPQIINSKKKPPKAE